MHLIEDVISSEAKTDRKTRTRRGFAGYTPLEQVGGRLRRSRPISIRPLRRRLRIPVMQRSQALPVAVSRQALKGPVSYTSIPPLSSAHMMLLDEDELLPMSQAIKALRLAPPFWAADIIAFGAKVRKGIRLLYRFCRQWGKQHPRIVAPITAVFIPLRAVKHRFFSRIYRFDTGVSTGLLAGLSPRTRLVLGAALPIVIMLPLVLFLLPAGHHSQQAAPDHTSSSSSQAGRAASKIVAPSGKSASTTGSSGAGSAQIAPTTASSAASSGASPSGNTSHPSYAASPASTNSDGSGVASAAPLGGMGGGSVGGGTGSTPAPSGSAASPVLSVPNTTTSLPLTGTNITTPGVTVPSPGGLNKL